MTRKILFEDEGRGVLLEETAAPEVELPGACNGQRTAKVNSAVPRSPTAAE